MSKNLEAKLAALLSDVERFESSDKRKALLAFIEAELNLMETRHNWNEKDLTVIRTRATEIFQGLSSSETLNGKSLYQNDELIRTYCYSQATYEYMRSQSMTPYVIGIQRKADAKTLCLHESRVVTEVTSQGAKFQCGDCSLEIKPVAWVSVKTK